MISRLGAPFTASLVLVVAAACLALALQFPFAFYSPDVSFHAAKLLRATGGDFFRDPFSGTPSLYPAAFHAAIGTANRWLGLGTLELVRLLGVFDLAALFASFFWLARGVLGEREQAALCCLSLSLLFYAPSGRHILVENPANFALPFLFAGFAFLWRHLESLKPRSWALGMLLCGVAVNVVWYDMVCIAAFLCALAPALVRSGRPLRSTRLASLAFLPPLLFTLFHLYSIRSVLPDYAGFASSELDRHEAWGALRLLREWLTVAVTRGNERFAGLLERSALASLHYHALVLPFGLGLLAGSGMLFHRLRRDDPDQRRARILFHAAALVFLFSLAFALTRDIPRLARVQFAGWALLLVFAFRACALLFPSRRSRTAEIVLAGLSALSLAYTVRHTGRPFTRELPRPTAAVVRFIEAIPGHADTRIFVSESNLRFLAPFVTFRSFVNHGDGRYYAQDPVSSQRLLEAYRSILERRDDWRQALASTGVRYLAFRHADGGEEREAGLFYLAQGSAVLQNPEWWVVEP